MEKNFFMTWIGDRVPDWALTSFNTFRQANPSYCCEFINFSMGSPGKWAARLSSFKIRGCRSFSWCLEEDDPCHRCALSELVRYYVIQTYGGICADCDMWPLKAFDTTLANLQRPFRITKVRPSEKFISDDINFMGCPKGEDAQNRPMLLYPIKLYDFDDPGYVALRDRFFSCALRMGECYNDPKLHYVDHYDSNTYGRNKRNPQNMCSQPDIAQPCSNSQ